MLTRPTSPEPFSTTNLVLVSVTYLLYYGQLGVLVPYLGIFLDGRGFTSQQIGELFALITIARILGPNLWASLADKTGRGLNVLRFGSLLTVSCFCLVFVFSGFWGITLSFALMMMFWTAVLPQLEVLTLNCVRGDAQRYSRIRLWGSIGFILLTVLTGWLIDRFSSEAPVYVSLVVLTALFLSSLVISEPVGERKSDSADGSIWEKVRTRAFAGFIVSAMLLQLSFGPFYGFFALYMRDLEYSGQQTGALIALGVVAEVFLFLIAGRLISRFGLRGIMFISLLLTAVRWFALASFAHMVAVVIASQLLHAFSFAMTHAASVYFIHHHFGSRFQSRGQALYVSLAFGLGGAIGNYLAGQLWDQGIGAYQSFLFAGVFALLSAAAALMLPSRMPEQTPRRA